VLVLVSSHLVRSGLVSQPPSPSPFPRPPSQCPNLQNPQYRQLPAIPVSVASSGRSNATEHRPPAPAVSHLAPRADNQRPFALPDGRAKQTDQLSLTRFTSLKGLSPKSRPQSLAASSPRPSSKPLLLLPTREETRTQRLLMTHLAGSSLKMRRCATCLGARGPTWPTRYGNDLAHAVIG
jgi:hypothetical protein